MKKIAITMAIVFCALRAEAPFEANMTGGKIHYDGSRYEKAAGLFTVAVGQKPANIDAHIWLGASLAKLQKQVEAAKEFVRALELDSLGFHRFDIVKDPYGTPEGKELAQSTLFSASVLDLQSDTLDDALIFIQAALKLNPDNAENYLQLTRVYLKLGKLDEVKKTATDMLAADPQTPDAYYFFGRYYFAKDQWDSAKVNFSTWLGMLSKRYEATRDTAMQLWGLSSEPQLLGILVTLDTLRKTPDKFRVFLKDSLKVPMNDPDKYTRTAQLIKTLFDSWRKLVPGYAEMGRDGFEKLDMEYAEEMYGKVVKLAPDNGDAVYNLGIVKYNRSKYGEARELLSKAADLFPNDDQLFTLLGHVYLLMAEELKKKGQKAEGDKEVDNAIKALEKAIELNPKNGDAHRFLGVAFAHKGDNKKAEEFLKKGQELLKESAPSGSGSVPK